MQQIGLRELVLLLGVATVGLLVTFTSSALSNAQIIGSIIGAGITAGVTLTGVILTTRQSQRSLERTITNENQKVRDQREFDAKKKAFIEAYDAITQAHQYLGGIPNLPLQNDAPINPAAANLGVKLNALHFYGTNETIKKCLQLNRVYVIALMNVLSRRATIDHLLRQIESLDTAISLEMNRSPSDNETIRRLTGEKLECIKLKYRATEECMRETHEQIPGCSKASLELMILLRTELGFEFDAEQYRDEMQQLETEMMAVLAQALAHIKQHTDDLFAVADRVHPRS